MVFVGERRSLRPNTIDENLVTCSTIAGMVKPAGFAGMSAKHGFAFAKTGPLPTAGSDGFSIGADNPPGAGSPLIGWIDQLRVFGIARSDAELCADAGACATD
ncbi:MAG: hypothetical protein JWO36_2398 [Myxococcales bacterium]|nr:hypothetical protein [Myxococcales bacterium]